MSSTFVGQCREGAVCQSAGATTSTRGANACGRRNKCSEQTTNRGIDFDRNRRRAKSGPCCYVIRKRCNKCSCCFVFVEPKSNRYFSGKSAQSKCHHDQTVVATAATIGHAANDATGKCSTTEAGHAANRPTAGATAWTIFLPISPAPKVAARGKRWCYGQWTVECCK